MRWRAILAPAVALAAVLLLAASARGEGIAPHTQPSEDVTLAFTRAGRVLKVLVKPGDAVKAGQLLVQLDDAAERARLEQLKIQAQDTTRIRAAEAQLAQRKVDLAKLEWAFKRGAATDMEVERARLDVKIAELSLELAQVQHKQDQLQYEQARIELERMRLLSPISGRVEQVVVEPGESADALQNVIRVVNIDPLWVDVPASVAEVRRLKLSVGDPAEVTFLTGEAGKPGPTVAGKVIYIAAVADAASNTRTVRVEVPNAALRPAGEHVRVRFKVPPRVARLSEAGSSGGAPESPSKRKE